MGKSISDHFSLTLILAFLVFGSISYVAEGPFEEAESINSSLTHILPLVNTQFQNICKSEVLWMESLCRLTCKYPSRCQSVFKRLLKSGEKNPKWSVFYQASVDKDDFMLASKVQHMHTFNKSQIIELVSSVYESLSKDEIEEHGNRTASESRSRSGDPIMIDSARTLHLHVVKEFTFITLPVFHMRCNSLYPGVQMNLTFFEPRYRMLVSEVMDGRRASESTGRLLDEPRPRFIFVHKSGPRSLSNGAMAYLVEISRCRMQEGGRAHIMIKPLKKVRMVSVSERQGVRNGLSDARIKRFD